jgi:hypothetical protein
LLVLAEVDLVAEILAFRDGDGDGARELLMAGDNGVIQLAAGQSSGVVLLPGGRFFIGDLAVADLDGDEVEDVVVAGEGLRTITATGVAAPIDDKLYYEIELCDLPPHDGVIEGVALASGKRPTSLSNDGMGNLSGEAPAQTITEDRALAGAFLGGHRRAIIAKREGITTWMFGLEGEASAESASHPDLGVLGKALAGGDLVAGGSDELLRLSPGSPWTVATQWTLEGEKLIPGPRGRIASWLDLVQLGDVDGDGSVDAVLAGPDGVILWRAPGLPASPTTGCVSTLALDRTEALAVGDHDGDGRADIAIATEAGVGVWGVTP